MFINDGINSYLWLARSDPTDDMTRILSQYNPQGVPRINFSEDLWRWRILGRT